jgi:hypothetical protein
MTASVPSPQRQPEPGGQASRPALSRAAQALSQAVVLVARDRFAQEIPPYLGSTPVGYGLCGADSGPKLGRLRRKGILLLADQASYEDQLATESEPLAPPPDGGQLPLFGGGLDGLLTDQVDRGAALAMVPTRYVQADDSPSLKAIMEAARKIQRDDVLVPVALHVAWLRDDRVGQLAAALRRIPHPKALVLGDTYNPSDRYKSVPKNLRALYSEVPDVGLWRTDPVTGFDCLAYGGLFAGIGVGTSLRHLVPPGKRSGFGKKGEQPPSRVPSIFMPEMMSYYRADKLADKYADIAPPPCDCGSCQGRLPDRFNDTDASVRQAAEAHNLTTWAAIIAQLLSFSDRNWSGL